jgi:hypothetical protein
LFVPDVSYLLDPGESATSQTVNADDDTSLGVVNGDMNLTRNSVASLTEQPTVSNKSLLKSTEVSKINEVLSQTEDVARSHWIPNDSFISNRAMNFSVLSTLPYDNEAETLNNVPSGTSSESYLKNVSNTYHNLSASLEKYVVRLTQGNISKHSELSAKSGHRSDVGQKTDHSAENPVAYSAVVIETSYNVSHSFISNGTERADTKSSTSPRNYTEISRSHFVTDRSEDLSTDPYKHLTEISYKKSEVSTENLSSASADQQSKLPTERLISNGTRTEANYSKNVTGTSIIVSSRRTRDDSARMERQTKASKKGASGNAGETADFGDTTTDNSFIISSGQVVNKPWHTEAKLPRVHGSSGSTENASTIQGGQWITISVENSPRSSSSSAGNTYRSSTNSAGRSTKSSAPLFRNAARLSSSDIGSLKNFPVGE